MPYLLFLKTKQILKLSPAANYKVPFQYVKACDCREHCKMYDVYLFNLLFIKFLLTQILQILMVNKL